MCPTSVRTKKYKLNKYSNGTYVPGIYYQKSQDQPAAMHIAHKGTAGVANTKTAQT